MTQASEYYERYCETPNALNHVYSNLMIDGTDYNKYGEVVIFEFEDKSKLYFDSCDWYPLDRKEK